VDSALLVAAGLVSHNIVVQLRPGLDERRKVLIARSLVACFGVLAYLMAVRADRIYELVEQSSAFGSAGIVVVVLFGLFTRIGDSRSAIAALLAGVAAWIAGAYLFELPYPYLTSLAIASAAYLAPAVIAPGEARVLEPVNS
jgi:Na+/proline symporter